MELTPFSMPDSPMLDLCDSGEPLPAHQPGTLDAKGLVLELLQTAAGAGDLANALKDRHVRGVLEQHGVQVRATDDVGYNSLPLELRAQIRGYVIEDLKCAHASRKCCPRISSYACVDTEWRAAIEFVTFRSLQLKNTKNESDQEFALFARYVVGTRRFYLQRIFLPCLVQGAGPDSDDTTANICTDSVHRLFNFLGQWHEMAQLDKSLHLELTYFEDDQDPGLPQGIANMRSELANLPSIPVVTHFYYSTWGRLDAGVFLALLSRLPRLQHTAVHGSELNFRSWMNEEADHTLLSRLQLFFTILSNTTPALKGIEFSEDTEDMDCPVLEISKAVMSYSQKLYELSFMAARCDTVLSFFHPFLTENLDPHVPPRFAWPSLTSLKIGPVYRGFGRENPIERMNQLILAIGRAIRHMPLIQSLEFKMPYGLDTNGWDINALCLTLKLSRSHAFNNSRADLFISHKWLDPEGNVTDVGLSEEAKEVWRDSLLKGANAVLEVHAE